MVMASPLIMGVSIRASRPKATVSKIAKAEVDTMYIHKNLLVPAGSKGTSWRIASISRFICLPG